METLYRAAAKKASELELEVERLQGRLDGYDEACRELSRIRSKHAEEVEAIKSQSDERLARLRKEATEEGNRLSKMIGESEGTIRELKHGIVARDERIKWHQGRLNQLNGEMEERQSRINDLRERVEQVRADKLRAISEAEELAQRLARCEEEVMGRKLEVQTLQGELASSRGRSAELEKRVAEAEELATLLQKQVAESEVRFGMLKGEQDVECADAFRLGVEDARAKVSAVHPGLDLTFLDAEASESRASRDEEDEYGDDSDADPDAVPGVCEHAASKGEPLKIVGEGAKAPEKGETSQAAREVPEEDAGAISISDS